VWKAPRISKPEDDLSLQNVINVDHSGKAEICGAERNILVFRTPHGKPKVEVFWVAMPCSIAVGYKLFGGPCCLHLHGEVTGMKAAQSSETLVSYHNTTQQ
jgi:hypothetical protein